MTVVLCCAGCACFVQDIRALDNISFADWFKSHGGNEHSLKRMWDPIGELLGAAGGVSRADSSHGWCVSAGRSSRRSMGPQRSWSCGLESCSRGNTTEAAAAVPAACTLALVVHEWGSTAQAQHWSVSKHSLNRLLATV